MVEIEFNFNQSTKVIFADFDEPFNNIINKYLNESLLKIDSVYFSVNENIITDTQSTLENFMNDLDKKNKKLKILVNEIQTNGDENDIGKEQIISKPQDINNSDRKEKHRSNTEILKNKLSEYIKDNTFNGINFDNSDKTPFEKDTEISCDKCKFKNKDNFLNNELYRCLTCQLNLCLKCKLSHNQNHNIINPKINEEIISRSKTNNLLAYGEQVEDESSFYRNIIEKMELMKNK